MGKKPIEPKNENFITKTYTFYVTKCDDTFYLLVSNDQIVIPRGLKDVPLKQRKKKGFCKFHKFLDNKTSQCILFRDLFQNTLKDERLKFAEKLKSRPEGEHGPKVEETLFVDHVDVFMVDIAETT